MKIKNRGIEITDKEIERVEKLLLPDGEKFDFERKQVIKCLEKKDVQACPGSGKTTALIAKLMILLEHMPFEDGRGICVLTHTNVAIDKIKEKLQSKSDILFNYPNHFGTFQSFVDKFLAIPALIEFTGRRPKCIDNDIYNYEANKFKFHNESGLNKNENNKAKAWLHRHGISNIRFSYDQKGVLINLKTGKEISLNKNEDDEKKNYNWIKSFKSTLLREKGIVSFEEAYMLANRYLTKYPALKNAFSRRFKYVFIDEMQDTDVHQDKIIETLFDETVVVQKIGDPYQAIFDREVKKEEVWKPRNPLVISGSKRFGEKIAKPLRTICVKENKNLQGNPNVNSTTPHIILFDDDTIDKVIGTFAALIHKYDLDKPEGDEKNALFKAVGWVGLKRKEGEEHKLSLPSYFSKYRKSIQKKNNKIHFKNLKSYLRKQPPEIIKKRGTKMYRDALINAFVRLLDEAGIKNASGQKETYFTPFTLLVFLKDKKEEKYIELKQKMADWILEIQNSEDSHCANVRKAIRSYIKDTFIHLWEHFDYEKIKKFVEDEEQEIKDDESKYNNVYPNTNIEIGTIHWVKGETHKATLYLETFYNGHESEKIIDFIKGDFKKSEAPKAIKKKTLKMAYVGMSRSTHLLCLAMHKKRIKEHLKVLDIKSNPNGWEIIDLTERVF